jgi:hypothetical protein
VRSVTGQERSRALRLEALREALRAREPGANEREVDRVKEAVRARQEWAEDDRLEVAPARNAVPSSSGCAVGASGCTQAMGNSRSRKSGESRPSGWIAEQTSCMKPGSVRSSERMPPPIVAAAS